VRWIVVLVVIGAIANAGSHSSSSSTHAPAVPANSSYDSGDPCDSGSNSYDASACDDDAIADTDSYDPCDPASSAYDESLCDDSSSSDGGSDGSTASDGCDSNYEGACVPTDQGDVDCGDLGETDFDSVGDDPDSLDADGDGVACESSSSTDSPSPSPSSDGGASSATATSASDGCDSNYEGACVPTDQGDVDCGDLGETDFDSVGDDPDSLDADGDGVACES
jgi:hypothetical protein